jgi:TonB family protein
MRTQSLTTLLFTGVLLCASLTANSQTKQGNARLPAGHEETWVNVAPDGEDFTVLMPLVPHTKPFEEVGDVQGFLYTVKDGVGVTYTIWSVKAIPPKDAIEPDAYDELDNLVEYFWETLMKRERSKLPKEQAARARLLYRRDLTKQETVHGREYSMLLGKREGTVNFYLIKPDRIYVLVATSGDQSPDRMKRFMDSFSVKNPPPPEDKKATEATAPAKQSEESVPGRGGASPDNEKKNGETTSGEVDYNRVFKGSEVTQKPRILSKPEPLYTEQARQYEVTGTVVLRIVFASSGEVTNILTVKTLPHGLTKKSIEAARQIKFDPATKDGRQVSIYLQLEYNFNIY